MSTIRADLHTIMQAALAAVDPYTAVHRYLRRDHDTLQIATTPPHTLDLRHYARIWVLGAGKATAPMAHALEEILGEALTGGIIVVKYDHGLPLQKIEVREAGHPVPDEKGLQAGAEILALARNATGRDLVIGLLSGGGSALLEALSPVLSLSDLQATTHVLLACGATISETNTIRKHLSLVKGGRLAQAIAPAALITLVLSDVVGSPLDAIASGPTVPDPGTWNDVQDILNRYHLHTHLPASVRSYLQQGAAGEHSDTPKTLPPSPVVVIGDNAIAAQAAATHAHTLGLHPLILTTMLEGEAREVGGWLVALAKEIRRYHRPVSPPACLIIGGETTVTLGDSSGKGGRNQEVALTAALGIAGQEGLYIGALATDGTDGPTDSAGAIVDSTTVARATALGFDPIHHLDTHNAYPLLDATGDLLRIGPTRTNVNDLLFVIVV